MRHPFVHPLAMLTALVALLPADLALVRQLGVSDALARGGASLQASAETAACEARVAGERARDLALGVVEPVLWNVTRDALAMTPWQSTLAPVIVGSVGHDGATCRVVCVGCAAPRIAAAVAGASPCARLRRVVVLRTDPI